MDNKKTSKKLLIVALLLGLSILVNIGVTEILFAITNLDANLCRLIAGFPTCGIILYAVVGVFK